MFKQSLFNRAWLILSITVLVMSSVVYAQDDYEIPEMPDTDSSLVIGRVGDTDITLEMFFKRVRFSRVQTYQIISSFAEDQGEEILDLDNPENQAASPLLNFLSQITDEISLGGLAYNSVILDHLYHQEAQAREIEPTECEINQAWADQLMLPPLTDCELPEGFEAEKAEMIDKLVTYTGMTAEEIDQMVLSQAEASSVREAIGNEFEAPTEPTVRTSHIRVNDLETANEVIEKLNEGEDFEAVLEEYTVDQSVFGNGGNLGEFEKGMMVAPFEEAAFNAEVGEIVGPVQTDFGYHVIEVLDQRMEEQACARHILLDTEEEAEAAIRLLDDGRDFAELAREYSTDGGSATQGGDLGCFARGAMVPAFEEAVFNAEVGEVVGPVQTDFGYHVIETTAIEDRPAAVTARHILVETEEEAQAVLDRLQAGEDFADLAREVSIDPSAKPLGTDTMTIATGGRAEGFYGRGEILPEFDVVFDAEVGDVVGPVETSQFGYFIFLVQETGTREATNAEILRQQYVLDWETEQRESDRIETTDLWRGKVPLDPMPGDVNEVLSGLDEAFVQAHEDFLTRYEANLIPNVLGELQLPAPPETGEEAPPSDDE